MMGKTRILVLALLVATLALGTTTAAFAQPAAGFGELYYDGEVVRTVVPPAAAPKKGTDPFYVFTNGAPGQLPVAGTGPGDRDYRGGKWAFHAVTWNTAPEVLRSQAEIQDALAAEKLAVVRVAENDFKCPIQP